MQIEDDYNNVPVLLLTINEDMIVETFSNAAQTALGDCAHCAIAELADTESVLALCDLMRTLTVDVPPMSRVLTFRGRHGKRIVVAGLVEKLEYSGAPRLRITALYDPRLQPWLGDLIQSEEIHRVLVQASSEAMWCIKFSEPVDLTVGNHEIIRQVFENECHWLMCNESMARLYNLPEGLDLNRQPVSMYFPRNSENEAFVRQIIESDFAVDNALSIDTRHDGSAMYVENTVRCDIKNGRLLRMWGSVRDVTGYQQLQNRLAREAHDVRNVLNALPDAILVINRDRLLLAVNSSFETMFGWKSHQFLGMDIQAIINLEATLPGGRRWYGVDSQRWIAEVRMQTGCGMICDAQISPVGSEAPDQFVLTLRSSNGLSEPLLGHARTVVPMPIDISVGIPR